MLSWMIAISSGIAVVCLFSHLPPQWLCLFALIACAFTLFFSKKALLPLLFLAGMAWGINYGYSVLDARLPYQFEGREVWVKGLVVGLPSTQRAFFKTSQRFQFKLTAPLCLKDQPTVCVDNVKKLQLTHYDKETLKPGQHWRLLVKLKRPYGMSNPGGFDYQSWLIQQGIHGVGYVRPKVKLELLQDQIWRIDRLRWQIATSIDKHSQGLKHTAFFKALIIGDKRDITRQQWDLFAVTGISHLMVISGLHVGLICMLVFWLSRMTIVLLCKHCAAERWAAITATLVAVIYALMAGFSLPTQRALVMVITLMLVIFFRRNIVPASGLAAALLVCLIIDPLAPISQSFWLSFIAVACLLYGATGRRRAKKSTIGWMSAQYLVFIGLLPVLAMLMGRVSLLSPLANSLLVPLFSLLIIPANFLAGLLSLVAIDSALFIWAILDHLIQWSLQYLQWLEMVATDAVFVIHAKPILIYVLAALGVGYLLLPKGMPYRYIGLVLLLPLFVPTKQQLNQGDIELTVLDVGQGLSVVVQTKSHLLVYDVGSSSGDNFNVATAVVLPFLHDQGLTQIDELVISHADNDHAGAWYELPKALTVKHLYYGEPLTDFYSHTKDIKKERCTSSQQWQWDGVHFEFFHPVTKMHNKQSNSNNQSCVLKITSGEYSFLLPGDIDKSVEINLIERHAKNLAANVLIAPHHGSNSSSSWPFIKWTNSDYVVFSSGYLNRFGHPRDEIIERYQQAGAKSLTTSESGAITFSIKAGQLHTISEYRIKHKRYWL